MEGLLTPVSTSYKTNGKEKEVGDALVEVPKPEVPIAKLSFQASSPEGALEILKNEPDHDALIATLRYLVNNSHFDITSPSPLAAQLVHVLVSDTVPNYWNVLQASQKGKNSKLGKSKKSTDLTLLLSCLQSITGLNAVLLSVKQHIQVSKESKKTVGGPNIQDILTIYLQLLQTLLGGDDTVRKVWQSVWSRSDPMPKQRALWNEFLNLVGGGKILGFAAEAEDVIRMLSKKVDGERYWIAEGSQYSKWLSGDLVHWIRSLQADSAENEWKSCSELFNKSLRLGHKESIIKELIISLLLTSNEYAAHFTKLLDGISNFEQRNVLYDILKIASKEFLSAEITTEADAKWWESDNGVVSAVGGLINLILGKDESRKNHLLAWLTSTSLAGLGDGIAIRRAVIATLAQDKTDIETVLDKSLHQFRDQLYIRHTPTFQQEVHAQVLLLAAGYVHRKAPLRLSLMMRSGAHLSAVSNRLAASSPRARFLGMVVGEALSSLVDKGDKKMDFKMDEMNTAEGKWYKSLVNVSDTIGSLEPLRSGSMARVPKKAPARTAKAAEKPKAVHRGTKIVAIEEIEDDGEEEPDDDDLVPHAKPDSDTEDLDEDPTLITRNKPTAPVYIRDLITYLRDTESYDKQKLGLQTAASLIRRKANFGTEVSSHAEELATLLVGIQDKYEIDNFQDMRLQGMIAILIALPLEMGQWYSKTFFDGDYSISQRASILTTLGIGARELGGFSAEDSSLTSAKPLPSSSSFPSKALPESMYKFYASPPPKPLDSTASAVEALSTQLSNTMIAPMAADLADKLTGPSILKVRTFSSRMAVEAKRKKPIANSLAKIVADGVFFPLTGRFFMHLKAYGSSHNNIAFQPHLLTLFVKTLGLLIHASGPSTLSLPQMTSEFWDLLLSLRARSIGDITVIEALLFAFLTILEINEDKRRLVESHGRQMLETQEWVEGVFGRLGSGGSEEDERVRMLAAGCLVRIREVVEKYQALLMGDLANF